MADAFEQNEPGLASPIENAAAVTPSDSTNLADFSRALWVGTAGDVEVDLVGSGTVILKGVVGLVPVRVKRVRAGFTTAADIVALW